MAFNNSTVFGPDVIEKFWSTALNKGTTIETMTLIPGVKNSIKLPLLNLSGIVQADSCDWTPQGDINLAEKLFTVCDSKVNLPLCAQDLEKTFEGKLQKKGANNSDIPATFEEYLLMEIANHIAADNELLVWQGAPEASPAVGDCTVGLLTQFLADSAVVDVTGTTITASNVLAEMGKLTAAIPVALKYDRTYNIYINAKTADLYESAMVGLYTGSERVFYQEGIAISKFKGYNVVISNGLPDNQMVAMRSGNAIHVTDANEDTQTIEALDQSFTGSKYTFYVARWKQAFGYMIGSEIAYYH